MKLRTLKGLISLFAGLFTINVSIAVIANSMISNIYLNSTDWHLNSTDGYFIALTFIHAGFAIFCLEYIAPKWIKFKSINEAKEKLIHGMKSSLQLLIGLVIFISLFYFIKSHLPSYDLNTKDFTKIFGYFPLYLIIEIPQIWLLFFVIMSLSISFGVEQLNNHIKSKHFNLRWQYFFEYFIVIVFGATVINHYTHIGFFMFFRTDFKIQPHFFFSIPPILLLAIPYFVFFIYPKYLKKNFFITAIIFTLVYSLFGFLSSISLYYLDRHPIYDVLFASLLSGFLIFINSYYFLYKYAAEEISIEEQNLLNYNNNIAQLQALKAQINPHFIFNTLNTLYGTALIEKADESADAIQKLGEMIRLTLDENKQKVILLQEELNFIENYLTIHQLNIDLEQKIESGVTINLEGDLGNMQIQTFTILPFIQYLANYNTIFDFKKFINIFVEVAPHTVTIVIKSNILDGRLAKDEEIKNLIHKLDHFYGKNHSFHIIENNPMHIEIMINK